MTIESLGRKGGPKPGEHGIAPARHGRRPQPETRAVPTARPKPAPPRTPLGEEARRPAPQPQPNAQAQVQAAEGNGAKTAEAQGARERGQGQAPGQRRGRGDGKTEGQNRGGDRSLYDGGSPSANRLGPAKAMRARDVSRPRDW